MRKVAPLSVPGYAISLWLLVFPFVDVLSLAFPLSPTMAEWRYSLTEVLSRSLMTPALGMFGILLFATTFRHERVRRALSMVSGIGAVLAFSILGVFLVDSLGLRAAGGVRQGMAPVFGGPWLAATAKLLLALLMLMLIWRAARGPLEPESSAQGSRAADPQRGVVM